MNVTVRMIHLDSVNGALGMRIAAIDIISGENTEETQ